MFGDDEWGFSEPSSSSKGVFGEPKMYIDQEWYDWELENMKKFSKCADNSANDYNQSIDYGE